ncbi:hypothetical protein ETK12_27175 [Salmonella enterica]|nr:hypothetical protein [Salmonella enterica]
MVACYGNPDISSLQGKARQGKARQGKARQGKARQGNNSFCLIFSRLYISFPAVSVHDITLKLSSVTELTPLYSGSGIPVIFLHIVNSSARIWCFLLAPFYLSNASRLRERITMSA